MRITKRIVKKLLIDLSKEYNIRIFFNSDYDFGSARYWNNSISISYNQNAQSMISTFFHELGHIYCFNNGIWQSFHIDKSMDHLTDEEKRKFYRTALKAERWVDTWAKKEMKKHFPSLRYISSYFCDDIAEQFRIQIKKELYGNQ